MYLLVLWSSVSFDVLTFNSTDLPFVPEAIMDGMTVHAKVHINHASGIWPEFCHMSHPL